MGVFSVREIKKEIERGTIGDGSMVEWWVLNPEVLGSNTGDSFSKRATSKSLMQSHVPVKKNNFVILVRICQGTGKRIVEAGADSPVVILSCGP